MTDTFPPMAFDWNGESFVPIFPKRADRFLTVGQRYTLAQHHERSTATHNHEFAWLNAAWQTLPDEMAERFSSPEHLRKWALIRAGYSDSHTITCASKAEAQRVAAFIRPIDEFAIVVVNEATVTRYIAKSQSRRAMGAEDFQRSKTMIMDVIAKMLGVEPESLAKAAA